MYGYECGVGWSFGQRDDKRARARANGEAARAAADAAQRHEPSAPGPGPAALLRADRQVVAFTGRTGELAELLGWAASDAAQAVRVIAGPAGAGKTRLTLEMAERWHGEGGQWLLVPPGEEGRAVATLRATHRGPALLVVDDAEARPGLDELLRAALEDPGPIRVLLVTRSLGEWWPRLAGGFPPEVARRLTDCAPLQLDAPVTAGTTDAGMAEAAVPYFARALSMPAPGRVEVERAAQRVPVLLLHAAALVALLRFSTAPGALLRVAISDGVLDQLLEHEAGYWRRAAVAAGLSGDAALVRQLVAAALLLGAGSVEEASDAARRVPALAGSPQDQQLRWARWLAELYPAGGTGRLGLLQPDVLAETHVANELTADPELARSCLRDLTPPQAEHALTVLARGAARNQGVRQVIATALRDQLGQLGLPAARVALQASGDLGDVLARAIAGADAPAEVLADLALALPYPSPALAQAHLAATLQVLDSLPASAEPEIRAQWDDRAGLLLSELDRHADALRPAREAVAIRRDLAAADHSRYAAGLAASLSSLGARFAEAGRPADALRAEQETVTIYRELASADPAAYLAKLARSMSTLGVRYCAAGQADGLGAEREAVSIYRGLTTESPGQYRSDLAASLTNLGVWFSEAGRPADAVPPAREAVTIYRELAGASAGRYQPDLAAALTNLGIWFSEAGRPADAVSAEREAVEIRRGLAAEDPERYRAELARSLVNLGAWFSELGRPADALRAEQEAIAIRRELASAEPDRYRPDLAAALTNIGITYAQLGRPADALPAIKEAVTAYRELALVSPERFRPLLARTLASLGSRYAELGRLAAAVAPLQEALSIRRKLAAASPDRYRPDLARTLSSLGSRLTDAGRNADALLLQQEAVAVYRDLMAENPESYRPGLARALSGLEEALSALGQHAEAEQAAAAATAVTNADPASPGAA